MIGFHCSHEQHSPSSLLRDVTRAEAAGFTAAMCSDHFHPWTSRQGHSGFTWSWLGAALQATGLSFGTVCAPGQRYHPAIIGQAAATLAEMFPGRFWLALGSGEALNEVITGAPWPDKSRRQCRLEACARVMRQLWAGDTVTVESEDVRVHEARLYSRPADPPLVLAAALSPETARRAAAWADGLITVAGPRDDMRRVVDAFREGGGEAKPMYLQVALSFAPTHGEAERLAVEEWPQAALSGEELSDLLTPAAFEAATRDVTPEQLGARVRISSSIDQHRDWLHQDLELGFAGAYLHNVAKPWMAQFIEACGEKLLPAFAD